MFRSLRRAARAVPRTVPSPGSLALQASGRRRALWRGLAHNTGILASDHSGVHLTDASVQKALLELILSLGTTDCLNAQEGNPSYLESRSTKIQGYIARLKGKKPHGN